MASQDLTVPSTPLQTKNGINDTEVFTTTIEFYKLNGVNHQSNALERLCGKRISFRIPAEPIVAIHSNERGGVLIQTLTHLYLYDEYRLRSDHIYSDIGETDTVYDNLTGEAILVG